MYDKIINTNASTTAVDAMKSYIDKLNVGSVNIETLPTKQWQELFEVALDNKNETITTYDPSIFVCAPGEALGMELTISCSFDITKTWGTTTQRYCVDSIGGFGLMGFIRSINSTPYNYPALIDQNGKKFTVKYYPGTTDPNATYTYSDTDSNPLKAFNATSRSKAGGQIFRIISPISGYFSEPGYVAYELYSATNSLTGDKEFRGSVYFWPSSVGPDTQRKNGYTSISIKWFKYKEAVAPTTLPYVLFSSPSNNISLNVINNAKYWDGTLETSTDNTTWTTWDGTAAVTSTTGNIYVRGTNNTIITGSTASASAGRWQLTGTDISISGNIEALLDYQTVAGGGMIATPGTRAFYGLVRNNSNIIDASNLELPRTTLVTGIYMTMFYNCTGLTAGPELPATTLAQDCYRSMFNGSGIITASELPATVLAGACYMLMFGNCASLTTAPVLPATTLANGCYNQMFNNCDNLTSIPSLPATTLVNQCYYAMFVGCTNIKLSTTQTGSYVNAYRIPTTGTGTTASEALTTMFHNTGGTFTGTPNLNTTYYTSNTIIDPE